MMLKGVIDTHVHAGPDVRPRKATAYELARAARAAGLRAIVLKNHHCSTVPLAAAISEALPGIRVLGGLALNHAVGGFNLEAVDAALRMGAAQIWMPTLSAENECAYRGHPGAGLEALDERGQPRPEVVAIIRRIARSGAVLGTGHLSVQETAAVVELARQEGVRAILVTHPEIDFIAMDPEMQCALRGPGLFFERCFCRTGFRRDWAGLAADIQHVGVESTVLATDLGQPENPHPVEGLEMIAARLAEQGISTDALRRMMVENPAIALGLD
jgi:dihydroorotase-like cyclic amidohydrolase